MANRYDIVRIDFQANARGANAAIESLRQEAEKSNAALTKTREEIDRALKANAPDDVIAGLRAMAKTEERRYKQLSQAQNELIKGMRVLDQGVKMFNDGSLNQMNAAFQKAVNNAAKLAQSKFDAGTKEWREMGAIMQETEQNYARMQRDTDQLIQVIQQGGTVFRSTLEQEKKGIQELMGIVPYMGSEYQKLEGQLQVVTTKLDQMATAERQMKGEIVTSNDARRVAYQLTEEGAAAAKREAEAAEQTIAAGKERISVLEKERKTREDAARATAETVAKRNEDLAMQQNVIASIEKEIANEDRKSKKKREAADVAKQVAESSAQAVETEKAALEGLQATTKAADEKVKQLEENLKKLEQTEQQQTSSTDQLKHAQEEYNQKVQQRIQKEKELKELQSGTYDDDPNIKQINAEIAKLEELIAVSDKYKKQFTRMPDDTFEKGYMGKEESKRSIWESRKYLEDAYDDKLLKAPLAHRDDLPDSPEYKAAAKRVAAGIVQNAQENVRRVIFEEIKEGKWTAAGMKEQIELFRGQMNQAANSELGLKDNPEYNAYKYIIAQMEKYIEVAKKVQEERKQIAGSDPFLEVAQREVDLDKNILPESLSRQKEKRTFEELTGWSQWNKQREDIELRKQNEVEKAKKEELEAQRKLNEEKKKGASISQQQTETIKQQSKEQKTLKSDIDALTGTIKELKKQRDELTAAQKEGSKSTEGEAQSAQDLMAKMKSLNDEIEKQKKKLVKPEQDYQKELRFAATAKKPEDRDRLAAEAAQKLDEKTEKTRKKIQELSKQLDETRDAYKALTKEEESAVNAAGSETEAVQKLTQARDRLKEMTAKSTFHESVSGERTITNPREAENYLLSLISANGGTVSKTQSSFPVSKFDNIRKAFGERYGMEKAEAEKWLKELISSPHGGIFTKAGGKDASGSYYLINNDVSKRLEFNKEKMQASKDLGATSLITDPAEIEKAYQAALKQLDVTEQQAAATEKLSEKTKQQTQATEKQVQTEQKQNEVEQQKATLTSQINALEEQKKQKQEQLRQLQQQSAEDERKKAEMQRQSAEEDKKKAELQKQLKDAQKELTNAQKEEEQQQKKLSDATAKANADKEKSIKMEEELANASADKTAELEKAKKTLGEMELATEKDIELNNQRQKELQETNDKIAAEGNTIREAEAKRAQSQTNSIKATEDAIRLLREENNTIEFNSEQWRKNAGEIQRLEAALGKMKGQATLQMMTDRMVQVDKLSSSALTETKRFWEAMVAGAENGSQELNTYKQNLEQVIAEEQSRTKKANVQQADKLLNGGYTTLSEEEIRKSIAAAREYQQTLQPTEETYKNLSTAILNAEDHLKKYGLEAERTSRKQKSLDALMSEQLQQGTNLSESALRTQEQYWRRLIDDPKTAAESIKGYQNELQRTIELQRQQAEITRNERAARLDGDLGRLSEAEIREAIEAGKQLAQSYMSTGTKAKEMAQKIVAAEEHIKQYGLEAQRAAQKQAAIDAQMRSRMSSLSTLSDSALTETKKYWEDMMRTQGLAEQKLSSYRIQLEKLVAEERRRKEVAAEKVVANMGEYSDEEIRKAVQAFEQLREAQVHGSDEWIYYNQRVQEGKKHLEEWAKMDSIVKMEEQMARLPSLSDNALQETKKFWETMVAGAERGSTELRDYEAHLERVTKEEQERRQLANEMQAQKITGSNPLFFNMSESEIRKAIEATKQLQQTVEMGEDEYDEYTAAIIRAEDHLKRYGIEGTRTYEKLKETNRMYESQLLSSTQISESALKAQEAYWRKLIDDPRTASDEAREYESNLERVHQLQQQMVKDKGQEALRFFVDGEDANASANTLEEQVKNLKAYRDSLPKERDADVIRLINEYIQKTGEAAKVASGEMMRLEDAEILAGKLGKQGFSATTTQLQQAKKALVEAQNAAGRGTPRFTELQSAINKVNLELAKTGKLSQEVKAVLDSPKGRSFNELKQAIEQGRAALQNMSRTTDEEKKDFDELAKKIKEADFEMRSLGNSSKGTASAFDKAWSRLKTYIGLYVGAAVAMQKLTATMGDLIELSDKMGEVRKTTGFTADEVGRLSENLKKMDTRTSITGLLELSVAAGQLGLKTQEDVQGFTEAANKLMVALPEMGREGATEMLKVALATGEIDKIRKQMQEGIIDGSSATAVAMEKVGSTIDRLRATSAATAPAITDFVKRVGAVGAQSGITIDQVAALGSTVDALGMRVEMSATALSRMIPAIKNNAFDVARAIGVTPDTLRNLFETGRGMEAILMIFQHIKDSGMGEDDIESMLGMGNMKEIMKELNQQGARAGIVFAGLSQNVDELRRQLGVAGQAYEENIAIQQEYDKMNETTAAKWERLKNQLEEFFVGDQSQRWLGGIIDGLRGIVDLLTGNGGVSVALRSVLVYLGLIKLQLISTASGALKAVGGGLKNIGIMLGFIKGEMTALQWGNIFTALAGALSILVVKFARVRQATQEALAEQGKYAAEIVNSEKAVEDNFKAVDKAAVSIEEANKKLKEAQAALEKARKEMDGSKESADRLTKAEQNLKKAEDDVRIANDAHRASIEQINKLYGKYLGFMLSEISSATELANARELINSKLRETITLKRKEAALGRLEENLGEDRDRAYGGLSQMLSGAVRRQVTDSKGNKSWATDQKASAELLRQVTKVAQDASLTRQQAAEKIDKILIDAGKSGDTWASWRASVRQRALEYQKEYKNVSEKIKDVETQFDVEAQADREESQKLLSKQYKEADKTYAKLEKDHANAQGEARKKAAADLLKQSDSLQDMVKNAKNYYDLTDEDERKAYDKFVKNSQARIDGIESQRNALLKEAGKYYKPMKGSTAATTAGGGGGSNVWGSNASAESTDYSLFDVNELVARRNQMDKFKNILKPDTDVRAVLAEDKALMKALDNGLQADWKSVLNWYNTERKKIQAELKSERFSTNMGHWRDETTKKGRRRVNPLLESDYALAELDRYYSRRKEKLEKARIEENMSEELFNRQADLLEQEHLERRSKLRETFTAGNTEQEKKMVTQFRLWWKNLEDSGELDEVPWATVESEWSKATAAQIGRNNLKAQQDLTQLQQIIVKHMNEIVKLIDKERPFDSITANLRKNLTEMDILLADLQKDGPEPDTAKLVKAETVRLKFLLTEAERAYSLTFDELKERMIDEGFGEWAVAVENDEQMKQSLLQNLRNAYDAIQDAIKKESNIIKKQLEIQWNDVMPGNDKSIKEGFEKLISDIGLSADSVKRANSLIGAGTASDRVADKLAIQQMRVQLQMQETYFAMMQKIGLERIKQLRDSSAANERESVMQKQRADQLRKEGKLEEAVVADLKAQNAARQALQDSFDAEHAQKSLNLATTKELTEEEKQRVAIANQLEESQNRLYTELKSWADLLSGSLQSVFEASHAGEAEYYNELAKLNLTGKGGPGAGTYVVIENEGTEDAAAHYEYLDEREALERQLEIERQNAQAEAWEKVMDDINMKMSETITDLVNATLQNASVDANTDAIAKNTDSIGTLTTAVNELAGTVSLGGTAHSEINPDDPASWPRAMRKRRGMSEDGAAAEEVAVDPVQAYEAEAEAAESSAQRQIVAIEKVDEALGQHLQNQVTGTNNANQKTQASTQSMFAKMTQALNLYGAAYQAMSNDNLSMTQKFEMIALQAAGSAAMAALTSNLSESQGSAMASMPGVLGKIMQELGPVAGPIAYAAFTALMGGLMGMAVSKVTKAKSQIAAVTGASVGAGRLATGMLTYAEGNVNEFTDPAMLTPGRQYNVDAADGKTYRARYMGRNPRTHLTNGPEFHLSGEKGKEMIIDAGTTRQITMNDNEIWRAIQTLSSGGRMRRVMKRGRGVPAFADGNVEDFEEMLGGVDAGMVSGMSPEQMAALQASIDRQSDLLDRALTEGIKGVFNVYGPDGLVSSYDQGKKTLQRHGERR